MGGSQIHEIEIKIRQEAKGKRQEILDFRLSISIKDVALYL